MHSQHVLVVEADTAVARLLAAFIEQHGYSVRRAVDWQEASTFVRASSFCLVLLSIAINCWGFVEELRASDAQANAITPIVAMTDAGAVVNVPSCLDPVCTLTKPIDLFSLSTALLRYCR